MFFLYHGAAMTDEREEQFKQRAAEFPDSPMVHFSLARLYLDKQRYSEAIPSLEEAVRLDPEYAAALVALGDAYAGAGQPEKARAVLERARATALGQSHQSLADDIDQRLESL